VNEWTMIKNKGLDREWMNYGEILL